VRRATWIKQTEEGSLQFLSTLSVRRATGDARTPLLTSLISIHALREESDESCVDHVERSGAFLSTLSVRRATVDTALKNAFFYISIHALREESD